MSDYTVTTNFGAKDSLSSGDAAKLIKGSEFTTEFTNIATAVATKADTASPTFTGTVTIPTANISAGAIVATSLDLEDDNKIKLGTGDDLEIYHDASGGNSVIADVGVGALQIRGSAIRLLNADGTETLARFTADGASELHYDNTKKLETAASGITVTGVIASDGLDTGDNEKVLLGDSDDLELYHGGTNSVIQNNTGHLKLLSDSILIKNNADDEFIIKGTADDAVELYFNNGKKLETLDNGAKVYGSLISSSKVGIGTDSPGKPLHVYNATTDVVGRFESGDADAGVEFVDTGGTSVLKSNNGNLNIIADNGNESDNTVLNLKIDGNNTVAQVTATGVNVTGDLVVEQADNGDETSILVHNTGTGDADALLQLDSSDTGESLIEFLHDGTKGARVEWFTDGNPDLNIATESGQNGNIDIQPNDVLTLRVAEGAVTVTGDLDTDSITLGTVKILTGSGAPNVAAPVGSLYTRTDGVAGETLYVKESGTDASGWVAK